MEDHQDLLARVPIKTIGEWLSLVEHLVRDQGVGGSNPLSPTNLFNHISLQILTSQKFLPLACRRE